MDHVKGIFKKYIYKSDSMYVVGLFKVKESNISYILNKTITFTGTLPELYESETYLFEGDMINHQKYGEQFNVLKYQNVIPEEKDGVIIFLSSPLFPGIGKKKAEEIVDILGNNALNIILDNPEELDKIKKLTKKQKETIYNNLKKHQESYKIILTLNELGFNSNDALKIYNYYKSDSENIINDNPYLMIDDIKEITLSKIERIRKNLKITDDDQRRIRAIIKYIIKEICFRKGHTYLYYEEIEKSFNKIINFPYNDFDKQIKILLDEKQLIKDEKNYYLKEFYDEEKYISKRIISLAKEEKTMFIDDYINQIETETKIKYSLDQKIAIKKSALNNFLVITGGPGTGKTTIIKGICRLYQLMNNLNNYEMNNDLALLAPTGRASKRISEDSIHKASTIHRFLKWNKEDDSFAINESNKSDTKLIIVDEASMIDLDLFYNLLKGLKKDIKLILIGDSNQLPSVGPGQIFKDIIDSNCTEVCFLNELYRREKQNKISILANDITNNTFNDKIFNQTDELLFIEATPNELKDKLFLAYQKHKDKNIQVLAPLYKGLNGIDDLNNFLQSKLNKSKGNIIQLDNYSFKKNDKVIQLINSLDDGVFNGDLGEILTISKTGELSVVFDEKVVNYTKSKLNNLKLGYTISIHKSQGSEFDCVIIPVLNRYNTMLYKKLIYTGITRAKKNLILVGEKQAFIKAISTNYDSFRKTSLNNFLVLNSINK